MAETSYDQARLTEAEAALRGPPPERRIVEAMRIRARNVVLAATVAVAAAAGLLAGAGTAAGITFCSGVQLTGSFAVVPGSAGAGNIVYRLTLRNRSTRSCSLTGLPVVTLLGRTGASLPTHGIAAHPGRLTAILVTLSPGRSAHATARFSPDVPGIGEHTMGACEPTAYRLRVTAKGGGSDDRAYPAADARLRARRAATLRLLVLITGRYLRRLRLPPDRPPGGFVPC